ncbi:hypothetical protein D3C81_1899540 [compost metagenome]
MPIDIPEAGFKFGNGTPLTDTLPVTKVLPTGVGSLSKTLVTDSIPLLVILTLYVTVSPTATDVEVVLLVTTMLGAETCKVTVLDTAVPDNGLPSGGVKVKLAEA